MGTFCLPTTEHETIYNDSGAYSYSKGPADLGTGGVDKGARTMGEKSKIAQVYRSGGDKQFIREGNRYAKAMLTIN